MADQAREIVAAKEHRHSRHWRQRIVRNLGRVTKEQRHAGLFGKSACIYGKIHYEIAAGRFLRAAKYVVESLSKYHYADHSCMFRRLFKETVPYDMQIEIWQEIARHHVIVYCGVNKDAQKELIARKLATLDSFKCVDIYRSYHNCCYYCGAELAKDVAEQIVYIKNPNREQLLTIFVAALSKEITILQLSQVKREIELYWPDLSIVPYEITSLLSEKIMAKLLRTLRRMEDGEVIWQLFLWGLDKFHYKFKTDENSLYAFIGYFREFHVSVETSNFILSHFPRQFLETIAYESPVVQEFLDNTSGTGQRTKVPLRMCRSRCDDDDDCDNDDD